MDKDAIQGVMFYTIFDDSVNDHYTIWDFVTGTNQKSAKKEILESIKSGICPVHLEPNERITYWEYIQIDKVRSLAKDYGTIHHTKEFLTNMSLSDAANILADHYI